MFGNLLDWPAWSGQFLPTIEKSGAVNSVKKNFVKTLVFVKAKAAIEGFGLFLQMYHVFWQTLERELGFHRSGLSVNAQLKKIHAPPFTKPYNSTEILKISKGVSGCVIVLSQFSYGSDVASRSALNSAVRKLPNELRNKWVSAYDKSTFYESTQCVALKYCKNAQEHGITFWFCWW